MIKLSNLTNGTAVANHGEAMVAETISKNGRSLKSQTSRRLNKFVAFLTLMVMFSSCSYRLVDFTVISSKNHGLLFDKSQGKEVEAKSSTMKEAMDKALQQAGPDYDLLLDGVVYRMDYFFSAGYKIRGLAVRSSQLRAQLGEEGFQDWLKNNNVFDPETALVQE